MLVASVSDLKPLRLERVDDTDRRQLWTALVDRHHDLGYRQPFGEHLRYFITDRRGQRLGCLLDETATLDLTGRDRWIGWSRRQKARARPQLIQNSRFLIFPWVPVKKLASATLALSLRQVVDDWQERYHFRPVLCETFVDKARFAATGYRAANWQLIGETRRQNKSVYIWPFTPDCRAIWRGETAAKAPPKPQTTAPQGRSGANDRGCQKCPPALIAAATAVAAKHDQVWQQRRRVFHTLLMRLFVIRLVAMPGRVSDQTALSARGRRCGNNAATMGFRCRKNSHRPRQPQAKLAKNLTRKSSQQCIGKFSTRVSLTTVGTGIGSSPLMAQNTISPPL